jgi:hypothetical protein
VTCNKLGYVVTSNFCEVSKYLQAGTKGKPESKITILEDSIQRENAEYKPTAVHSEVILSPQ